MHMQLKRQCVVAAAVASLQCLCSKAFVQPFSQHRAKQGIWPHQYSCKSTSLPVQQRARSYHVSMMTETTSDTSPGRKDEVLAVLSAVMDPDLSMDIVSLGFIKELEISGEDEGRQVVTFDVELTTPACPVKAQFQQDCRDLVEALPWVDRAEVTMTAQPVRDVSDTVPTGLSKVATIIAVSSCKGGVGKSTTAVNLAYALDKQGAKVGILDADIYGPSLPTMVKPDREEVEFVGNQIRPMTAHGVKLMSYGFVNQGAAIMRGPMVSQLLSQFVTLTSWGELDYLVIDMPPGTGDIQLTLCQVLNITAAVIVTTPQKLSFTDVVKGIDLFDTVNVPSVAVVENMAYYDVVDQTAFKTGLESNIEDLLTLDGDELSAAAAREGLASPPQDETALRAAVIAEVMKKRASTKQREYIFGKGHQMRLADMWGITNTIRMPLVADVASSGDSGIPLVVSKPDSDHSESFAQLAEAVVREVAKLKFSDNDRPMLSFQPAEGTITIETSGGKQVMAAADLRRQCRCALCVEEFSGKPLLDPASVPEDIVPTEFAPIGNYAVSVKWDDGHSSLYPYKNFAKGYKPRTKSPELSPV
ncbi:unnamed protein product [Ectocarpus sp. 12 AP-2014]